MGSGLLQTHQAAGSSVQKRQLSIHEHQAMNILRENGVSVPKYEVANSAQEAFNIAKKFGKFSSQRYRESCLGRQSEVLFSCVRRPPVDGRRLVLQSILSDYPGTSFVDAAQSDAPEILFIYICTEKRFSEVFLTFVRSATENAGISGLLVLLVGFSFFTPFFRGLTRDWYFPEPGIGACNFSVVLDEAHDIQFTQGQ